MAPEEHPCFTADGWFKPTKGCKQRCCKAPRMTPDGADTPGWELKRAQREAAEQGMDQPDFGSPGDGKSRKVPTPGSCGSSVDAFSPSDCSAEEQRFFTRRQLRKMNGQDPDKYTPTHGWQKPGASPDYPGKRQKRGD